jgi:hypothetical protein
MPPPITKRSSGSCGKSVTKGSLERDARPDHCAGGGGGRE